MTTHSFIISLLYYVHVGLIMRYTRMFRCLSPSNHRIIATFEVPEFVLDEAGFER